MTTAAEWRAQVEQIVQEMRGYLSTPTAWKSRLSNDAIDQWADRLTALLAASPQTATGAQVEQYVQHKRECASRRCDCGYTESRHCDLDEPGHYQDCLRLHHAFRAKRCTCGLTALLAVSRSGAAETGEKTVTHVDNLTQSVVGATGGTNEPKQPQMYADGYDAAFWRDSYAMLRTAVIEHLDDFVRDDDVAEEAILIETIERAGAALKSVGAAPRAEAAAKVTDSAWLVVRFKEQTPEVWKFDDEADARQFHDRAQMQWSECFLARIIKQGAQLDAEAAASSPKSNLLPCGCSGQCHRQHRIGASRPRQTDAEQEQS